MSDLKALFVAMDKDGSGHLDRDEIISGLQAAGFHLSNSQVDEVIKSVDVDGNGKVDYNEFVVMVQKLKG